jgi:O-Antigen ligase
VASDVREVAPDTAETRRIDRAAVARLAPGVLVPVAVAGCVFVLAYRNGTGDSTSRAALAIAVWWVLLLAVAAGVIRSARFSPAPTAAAVGLLGLTALAGLSALWAPSTENAIGVLDLDCIYLGIFAAVRLAARRTGVRRWSDGLALGIAAVVVLALLSRLFPSLGYPSREFLASPAAARRLSFPIGYWNALAAFGGLAAPLALRTATSSRRSALRGLAVAYLPVLAGVVYLSSSRIGALTTAVGILAFLALTNRRLAAAVALALGGAGGAVVVYVLHARGQLANGNLGAAAARQGHAAFPLILAATAAAGIVYALASRPLVRRSWPIVERAVLAALVVAIVAAVAVSHPARRFHAFKQLPAHAGNADYVTRHLLSGSGTGRWQLWSVAVKEFESKPLSGTGAGTYQRWWEQYRPFKVFVQNAHSLYLETLGELGVIGLGFLLLFVVAGLVAGTRAALTSRGEKRLTLAALTASFLAFAVSVSTDWFWQIPAVGAVGIVLLALVTVHRGGKGPARPRRTAPFFAPVLAVVAVAVILVEAIPLLADLRISASQAASRDGRPQRALDDAAAARDIAPWAATPYLQLALVEEQARAFAQAQADVGKAIRRDRSDWQLWFVQARIEAESGDAVGARRSLARAQRLNPLGVHLPG